MSKHIAKQYELSLEAAPVSKPRYSYSTVDLAKCGAKYYYSKVEKAPKEETYQMAAGTILDTAFNAYYENNAHLSESHAQRLEYARAAVEVMLKDKPSWFALEWSQKGGDVRSSPENYIAWLFDMKAIELVCRHDRGPVEVQKKVTLELPEYDIVGYIDCLELSTNTVVDVKSVTGWGGTTALQYALRSQVPLYRMILQDSQQLVTKGRYELLMCRKTPKLVSVDDPNIDFIQEKLVSEFQAHHAKMKAKDFSKNPSHCFDYNRLCPCFKRCWPQLSELVDAPQ